jgi:hypothetical protein
MTDQIDRIRGEILAEHRATGTVNREGWLSRYPEYRERLEAMFGLLARAAEIDSQPSGPAWPDHEGRIMRARENFRRIATVRGADPAEAALGQALGEAQAQGGVVAQMGGGLDRELLQAFTITYVVGALTHAGARLHQFMGQKLTYLAEIGLRIGAFRKFTPYTHGMFDKNVYSAEREAAQRGWLAVEAKHYRPSSRTEAVIAEMTPKVIRLPELADQYVAHVARRTNDELEVWGMTHHSGIQLLARGERITIPAVLEIFGNTKPWHEKMASGRITAQMVEQALEHLIRLQLLPPDAIDFYT